MQELVQAQSQDVQHIPVDFRDRPRCEVLGEMIEVSLPAQRTGDDLGREGAVALVGKMTTALHERRRQVGTFLGNRPERVIGRGTGGRGHGLAKRAPGWRR